MSNYSIFTQILKQAHTLIGGKTGGGKSVAINGIIYTLLQMMPAAAQMVLIDPKRVELRPYRRAPHCIGYADGAENINNLLLAMDAEMMRRYDEMTRREWCREYPGGHIYIIIDELADVIGENEYNKQYKSRNIAILAHILQLGRAAKIHVIAATQHPARKSLPAEMQRNFTATVALPQKNAIESRQMIGKPGAELLKIGQAYYTDTVNIDPIRVDIPYIQPDTLRAALDAVAPPTMPDTHTAPTQRPTVSQPRTVSAPHTMPTQRTQRRRIPGEILYIIAAIAIIGIVALQKIS